ncbi:hypothetical protein DDB_G0283289 [Dictyostelium discoideum AX4]|uniref:FNIP repeat-containing protein n=1 Tax=Dictyostelium discoideum TaxID=44689 RepID=Q54RA5_DICDI|nr:hypothetical protein DDB_G0283289 [Dictyostelium discoideum AX4]EAL65785.1 hypothetical protein DDB_G0283289 [Dictyostelium discoideum AX4]|eukprot:XP_639142.1 hypothetical protein DDB_G0283289 [Dictyostelium discoideum AX4]
MNENEDLFLNIWRNNILREKILKFIDLFRINNFKSFKEINDLLSFEYREFIIELEYCGKKELSIGDIPSNVETLILTRNELSNVPVEILPSSIKKIVFPMNNNGSSFSTPFTKFNKCSKNLSNLQCVENVNLFIINQREEFILIPKSLTSISFCKKSLFNEMLTPGIFANKSIKYLNLGDNWDNGGKLLENGVFEYGLLELSIPGYSNALLPGVIPKSVTSLSIAQSAKNEIKEDSIPNSVTKLYLTPIDVERKKAPTVRCIGISSIKSKLSFSNEKKSLLPSSVKRLIIKPNMVAFNLPQTLLPMTLTDLTLHSYENEGLIIKKGMLPNCLKSLKVATDYKFIEYDSLPSGLKYLKYRVSIPDHTKYPNCDIVHGFFPQSLSHLCLNMSFTSVSAGLFSPNQRNSFSIDKRTCLETLEFGEDFNCNIFCEKIIPHGVTTLSFGFNYDQPIKPGVLPNTITNLKLGGRFNHRLLPGSIPDSVVNLQFGYYYNKSIEPGVLPNSLKSINLGNCFDQYLFVGSIPMGTEKLIISPCFNQPIDRVGIFPSSLTYLSFNVKDYHHPVYISVDYNNQYDDENNQINENLKSIIKNNNIDKLNLNENNIEEQQQQEQQYDQNDQYYEYNENYNENNEYYNENNENNENYNENNENYNENNENYEYYDNQDYQYYDEDNKDYQEYQEYEEYQEYQNKKEEICNIVFECIFPSSIKKLELSSVVKSLIEKNKY